MQHESGCSRSRPAILRSPSPLSSRTCTVSVNRSAQCPSFSIRPQMGVPRNTDLPNSTLFGERSRCAVYHWSALLERRGGSCLVPVRRPDVKDEVRLVELQLPGGEYVPLFSSSRVDSSYFYRHHSSLCRHQQANRCQNPMVRNSACHRSRFSASATYPILVPSCRRYWTRWW
jgi:hypothetical protein